MENENKKYDLEPRTLSYAKNIRSFVKKLPKSISNYEDSRQIIRSSGSVGANYIEANESLSKKDFIYRLKIVKKEAKESAYWLQTIDTGNDTALEKERVVLLKETREILFIFISIISKVS